MSSPAMMVLPAPGSSASKKRRGWRGSISPYGALPSRIAGIGTAASSHGYRKLVRKWALHQPVRHDEGLLAAGHSLTASLGRIKVSTDARSEPQQCLAATSWPRCFTKARGERVKAALLENIPAHFGFDRI